MDFGRHYSRMNLGASTGAHEDFYSSSSHWFQSITWGRDTPEVEVVDNALSESILYLSSGKPIRLK